MRFTLFIILMLFATFLLSQANQLRFDSEKWPTGMVFHYQKSNWDGTHEGRISIFFKEGMWIESAKWREGSTNVSIIPAKIDPITLSVHHFKNIRCEGGVCQQRGEMFFDNDANGYIINFGPLNDTIKGIPKYWHSYDFDWASLMTAFIFKVNSSDHHFMRCDFTMISGQPGFGEIGKVIMPYEGIQKIDDIDCHVYLINGPGLENRGGKIWFSTGQNLLRGFKIDIPDEDSYQNVDFRFISSESMDEKQWEAFKKSKWSENK